MVICCFVIVRSVTHWYIVVYHYDYRGSVVAVTDIVEILQTLSDTMHMEV